MIQMFLKSDQDKAARELDCYGYCLSIAIEHFMNGNFEKAAIYHENVIRSLRELDRMKKDKEAFDELKKIFHQGNLNEIELEIHLNLRGQI